MSVKDYRLPSLADKIESRAEEVTEVKEVKKVAKKVSKKKK